MFISLKQIIPTVLKNKSFFNQINNIRTHKEIEKVVKKFLNQKNNSKFQIMKYKNKIIFIKTNNFSLSTELKLKEISIKKELKKEGILVEKIQYSC